MVKTLLLTFVLLLFSQSFYAQDVFFQTGHTNDILEVKFSPDDSQLISYSAGDGWFCLWDVVSGRLLWKTETSFIRKANESVNLKEFYWSKDGKFLITKSVNKTYQTWSAQTGKIISVTETKPNIDVISPVKKIISITKDYDDFSVVDIDTKETRQIKKFGNNSAFDTSNNGEMIAEGGGWGDASIRITNIKTGKYWWLDGHPSSIKTLDFSPDGQYLAVAGSDKNIYIFDVAKHSLVKKLIGHTRPIGSVKFSPDGKFLVSTAEYENLRVWDWQNEVLLKETVTSLWHEKRKIDFSPDGKYFVTNGNRTTIEVWNTQNWEVLRTFKTAEKYEEKSGNMGIGYDAVPVNWMRFSKDGKSIFANYADGKLRVWNMNQDKPVRVFKYSDKGCLVRFTPDEKNIITGCSNGDDLKVKLVDFVTAKALKIFDKEETNFIKEIAVNPNGKNFISSDVGSDILLWDLNKTKSLREFEIGFSGDDAIAFSPDGKTFAVGGRNQNLFVFDVQTGNKLWQLIPDYQPNELEKKLEAKGKQQRDIIDNAKALRDKQAAIDTEKYKKHVYITFEHYGDMSDPGNKTMLESDEPKESLTKKSVANANAVWLRLHNDSPLPIEIPTQSSYPLNPKCFFKFLGGQKISGLCPNREINIWHGLEDKNGKSIPFGFDFGSESVLLPKTSVLFPLPLGILEDGNAIRFSFTFQNANGATEVEDYGENITLKFRESNLPKGK